MDVNQHDRKRMLRGFAILVAVYLVWVATVRWVDQDAIDLDLPVATWSALMFGAGFFGIVIAWLLPWYWISLLLLLAQYLAGVRQQREHFTFFGKLLFQRFKTGDGRCRPALPDLLPGDGQLLLDPLAPFVLDLFPL